MELLITSSMRGVAGYREMVKGYRSGHGVRIARREDRVVLDGATNYQ